MTNEDILAAVIHLAQATTIHSQGMTAQANQVVVPRVPQQVSTITSCQKDFTGMNPSISYKFNVKEDPNSIDEVYNILFDMGLCTSERDNRPHRGESVTWVIFKKELLDWIFPREMTDANVVEFINLFQGGTSMHDYYLKFIQLSKYAPSLVTYPKEKMSHFVTRESDDLQE